MKKVEKVSETLNFVIGSQRKDNPWWATEIKNTIEDFSNSEDFRDCHIISIENDENGMSMDSCYGVVMAMRILRSNPKAKIMLYGFLPLEFVRTVRPEIDLALKHENVGFLQAPISKEKLQYVFQSKVNNLASAYTATDEAQRYLSEIFHDLGHIKDWKNPDENEKQKLERIVFKVRDYFPTYSESTLEEIIHFLEHVPCFRKEVMPGTKLKGVYCDIEGTLLINEKIINSKVLSLLKKYELEGKKVTLWTDGNVDYLKSIINSFDLGIEYPVISKSDFSGATAEIIIDDQDEFTFSAYTKINADKFIRVIDVE